MNTLEPRPFERVCSILDKHERRAARLIPILQEVQEEYRYLPAEVMTFVATALNLPPARVYGVATFYAHFTLEPKGKHVIRVCDGTACHVKQSEPLLRALQQKLGLTDTKRTSSDMLFTLEVVSCLGACGLAPVMVLNEDVHGQVTPERAVELVDAIIKKEQGS
jgi:NADH-quinone oxidoreductase subunit E